MPIIPYYGERLATICSTHHLSLKSVLCTKSIDFLITLWYIDSAEQMTAIDHSASNANDTHLTIPHQFANSNVAGIGWSPYYIHRINLRYVNGANYPTVPAHSRAPRHHCPPLWSLPGIWLYDILIPMAKQKKKRNKPYTGSDARQARPRTIKVNAVVRSRPTQWWHDNKRRTKLTIGGALVAAVIVWLIIEFIHLLHP